MKKVVAILMSAVLTVSLLAVMAVPVAAADNGVVSGVYYGEFSADWSSVKYDNAEPATLAADGTLSRTVGSGVKKAPAGSFVGITFKEPVAIKSIKFTMGKGSAFPGAYKVQYRDADHANPAKLDDGYGFAGTADFNQGDLSVGIERNEDDNTATVTFAMPVESNALLFQATSGASAAWNITAIEVTKDDGSSAVVDKPENFGKPSEVFDGVFYGAFSSDWSVLTYGSKSFVRVDENGVLEQRVGSGPASVSTGALIGIQFKEPTIVYQVTFTLAEKCIFPGAYKVLFRPIDYENPKSLDEGYGYAAISNIGPESGLGQDLTDNGDGTVTITLREPIECNALVFQATGNEASAWNITAVSLDKHAAVTKGDVNGDGAINAMDATRVLLDTVGKSVLTDSQIAAADVNGDGTVNAMDATLILLHVVGKKPIA